MKLFFHCATVFATLVSAALAQQSISTAQPADTALRVTESTPVYDSNNVVCVPNDFAPGFGIGSLASDGSGKTDLYLTPSLLFGREIKLGEVASISYYTKTSTTHDAGNEGDWSLVIYTKPYEDDISPATWYGARIGAEPYLSANRVDPANTWNLWSTDGPTNQLRFYDSSNGYFGSYTDPDFHTFIQGSAAPGLLPYTEQDVLYFSIQTGSAWADGFTGQLDGLTITLTDGSVATVNFECDDTDDDGIDDDLDHCPNSDFRPKVQIGSTTTSINNADSLNADGCTIQDLVNECEDHSQNHGQFVSCIAQLSNDLSKSGAITKKQSQELKTAAAQSNIGK